MARPRSSGTSQRILDVAERLIQTRGFNGFSYADVAADVGITKASLHYHFPTKADLGLSLVRRYQITFDEALEALSRSGRDTLGLLQGYVELYGSVLRKDRMCLCGMLAAEHTTLPAPMQRALQAFFDANERWLAGVLEAGRRSGELKLSAGPKEEARLLVAGLEGALLVARSFDDADRFQHAADRLLEGVLGGSGGRSTRARRPPGGARRSGSTNRNARPSPVASPH
jgi:TetR/AcrR family transcriptional regulator, transcriptional repressor for nem operon